jgi:hypothetical protein
MLYLMDHTLMVIRLKKARRSASFGNQLNLETRSSDQLHLCRDMVSRHFLGQRLDRNAVPKNPRLFAN